MWTHTITTTTKTTVLTSTTIMAIPTSGTRLHRQAACCLVYTVVKLITAACVVCSAFVSPGRDAGCCCCSRRRQTFPFGARPTYLSAYTNRDSTPVGPLFFVPSPVVVAETAASLHIAQTPRDARKQASPYIRVLIRPLLQCHCATHVCRVHLALHSRFPLQPSHRHHNQSTTRNCTLGTKFIRFYFIQSAYVQTCRKSHLCPRQNYPRS